MQSLCGTKYFDFTAYTKHYASDGIILYLENAELTPTAYLRALLSFKYQVGFENVTGILIGRNAAPNPTHQEIDGYQALKQALGTLDIPVLFDVDISHIPPNLTLINGAMATVHWCPDLGKISQTLN